MKAAIDSQNGKLEQVEHLSPRETKTKATKRKKPPTAIHELEHLRKRSATPISIPDAAELSSFHRRNTRPNSSSTLSKTNPHRLSQSNSLVKTPTESDAENGISPTSTQDTSDFLAYQEASSTPLSQSLKLDSTIQVASEDSCSSDQEFQDVRGLNQRFTNGSEFEDCVDSVTLEIGQNHAGSPAYADPTSLRDVSLPSPRMSPVTRVSPQLQSTLTSEDDGSPQKLRSSALPPTQVSGNNTADCSTAVARKGKVSTVRSSDAPQGNIPNMLDCFDEMPDDLKKYMIYQLLRRCSKPVLHFVADVVDPALRCDFIARLPDELSLNVLQFLDAKSLCRAAQVSRRWRKIADSHERAWKDLLDRDGITLADGELDRAIREGWGWQYPGWQYPHCVQDFEKDVSNFEHRSPDTLAYNFPRSHVATPSPKKPLYVPVTGKKRKAAAKSSCQNKKQKRKAAPESSFQAMNSSQTFDSGQGPVAQAVVAAATVPNPRIGLSSLQNLHLFKTLYQRHYMIRQSWMNPEDKPLHLAFRAHERHVVTCLQFDSDKIITGSDDSNIDIYETKTGASVRRLQGHDGGVWALEYDGDMLVSGSTDRTVRVWNMQDGKMLHVFQGHSSTVRCLTILKPVIVNETREGRPIMMPRYPMIITGSRDSSCRIWRLPKIGDRSIFQLGPNADDAENPYFSKVLTGHNNSVRAIAAYADTLVSGSYDTVVRVWKVSTGECVHRLQGHTQKVYSVVLDHPRGRCISGSMDHMVKVWSLDNGNCIFNLAGHTSLVGLLDLRDDVLVSAAADATLRVWDPQNGRCSNVLSAHTGAITCFLHDGQKIISGSDRTLKMWDTRNGECIRDLLAGLSGVWQIKFDERRCIAAVQRDDWTFIEVRKMLCKLLAGYIR